MEMKFNTIELSFIASELDAKSVYGIRSGLEETAPSEIDSVLASARESLLEKGIVIADFDGNTGILPEAEQILRTVFFCDRFISAVIRKGTMQTALLYHIDKDRVVETEVAEERYQMRPVTAQECAEHLAALCSGKEETGSDLSPFVLSVAAMNRIGQAEQKEELLRKENVPEDAVGIVKDMLERNSHFVSVEYLDERETGRVSGVIFLRTPQGTVRLVPTVVGYENCVEFRTETAAKIREDLKMEAAGILER